MESKKRVVVNTRNSTYLLEDGIISGGICGNVGLPYKTAFLQGGRLVVYLVNGEYILTSSVLQMTEQEELTKGSSCYKVVNTIV